MTEEEKFDDIIRKKFAEKEFVFNEENWEKAEQKIASSRRLKKFALWFSIFGIGLIAGVGLMLPFVQNDNNEKINIVSQINSESQKTKMETEKNISENANTKSENKKTAIYLKENNNSEKNVLESSVVSKTKELTESTLVEKTKILSPEKTKSLKNNFAKNESAKSESTNLDKKHSVEQTIENNETSTVSEENNNLNINSKTNEVVTTNAKTTSELQTDSTISISQNQEIKTIVADSASQKIDSTSTTSQVATPPPPSAIGGLASATYIDIELGTNYEFGWNTDEKREAQGFNLIAGIGITHNFNQKWSLYFAAQYGSLAYLSSQKKYSNVTYGFGSNSVDTTINTSYLHYAVIPIMLQYHINNKNAFGIGGSVSYLLNAKSKMSIKTTSVGSIAADSNKVNEIQKTENGYYVNAFNQWDASIAIAYRRKISKRMNVFAIANFGLLDIKNDTYFSNKQFERNSGIKIILTYNLFDF